MSFNSWFRPANRGSSIVTSLVVLNVAIYFLDQTSGGRLTSQFSMQPDAIGNGGEWWRLITAAFLHAGLLHLGSNMLALWTIGQPIEQMLGRNRFLGLYLLSALGGSVASYYFSSVMTQSVGASGAIFGLLTAFIVVGRRAGYDVTNAIFLLVLNIAIGFTPGIDWHAHFGGGVVGAATCYTMIGGQRGRQRSESQVTIGITLIIVVMLVMFFVRTKAIMAGTAF
jgi:membrane associated rhomboid family serine protease